MPSGDMALNCASVFGDSKDESVGGPILPKPEPGVEIVEIVNSDSVDTVVSGAGCTIGDVGNRSNGGTGEGLLPVWVRI